MASASAVAASLSASAATAATSVASAFETSSVMPSPSVASSLATRSPRFGSFAVASASSAATAGEKAIKSPAGDCIAPGAASVVVVSCTVSSISDPAGDANAASAAGAGLSATGAGAGAAALVGIMLLLRRFCGESRTYSIVSKSCGAKLTRLPARLLRRLFGSARAFSLSGVSSADLARFALLASFFSAVASCASRAIFPGVPFPCMPAFSLSPASANSALAMPSFAPKTFAPPSLLLFDKGVSACLLGVNTAASCSRGDGGTGSAMVYASGRWE